MEATTYSARRKALRMAVPDGAILILGNEEAPKNYVDNPYPFRQDSHFLYYAGVSQAGMALLIEPDGREVLFGTPEHPDDVIWFGPHETLEDHAESAGVDSTSPMEELVENLEKFADDGGGVHYLPPYRASRRFALGALLGADPREVDNGVSQELVAAVAGQRSVKGEAEISEMEDALAITAKMYNATMRSAAPGRTEAEIAAIHQAAAGASDRNQAFNPIVTVCGDVLHNTSYENTLEEGDLLLVDSGAESPRFYASDITRTMPVTGKFTSQQRDIYEVVLAANMEAIDAAGPGVTNRHLHLLAAKTVTEGLKDLGIMKGNVDRAVAAGAHALFFPHGIGHLIGLDVHDMEDLGDVVGYEPGEERSSQFGLNALRLAKKLEPGFVITIEPGVYFIAALVERWEGEGRHKGYIRYDRLAEYCGFGGVRIEDDVLITKNGHRVLGQPIPKSVDEIEEAMRG
ncbi:MAG: aminopeptidase P family protein [Acidobacteria bacterium]|jgi:Xaa-Pro aminopeptidase|nr:aminopeptidase P family protein [Acidobacteriota bacterium]